MPSKTVFVDGEQLVFADEQHGQCDIRKKSTIEYLLSEAHLDFEIAYERYGIVFDDQGREVDPPPPASPVGLPPLTEKESATAEDEEERQAPHKRPRGRPRKR